MQLDEKEETDDAPVFSSSALQTKTPESESVTTLRAEG